MHRELKESHGEAGTLHNIGSAHYYLANHTEAITYLHQAQDLKRQLRDQYFEACTLTRLGDTYHATNNSDAARDFWQQALTIFDQLGHPDADTVRSQLATLDTNPNTPTDDQLRGMLIMLQAGIRTSRIS